MEKIYKNIALKYGATYTKDYTTGVLKIDISPIKSVSKQSKCMSKILEIYNLSK